MSTITTVRACEILDSRGTPTIEVIMESDSGHTARFGVPSGASTGKNEAHELRDGDKSRYDGAGVQNAVAYVATLAAEIVGHPLGEQAKFDKWLIKQDGTPNKDKLGGNTILALSGAYLRLTAANRAIPLWRLIAEIAGTEPAFPRIYANLVNGGKHAPGLDIQEFMIVPRESKPSLAIPQIAAVYRTLGKTLVAQYGPSAHLVGDEGGYAPAGAKHAEIWRMLRAAAPTDDFDLAADAAASSFAAGGGDLTGNAGYRVEGGNLSREHLAALYKGWRDDYGLISIEDPFAEEDRAGFELIAGGRDGYIVVGDDISVTSAKRITELAAARLIGAVIIKPNQVGSVTETLDAIKAAHKHGVKVIVSHRSGETCDDFIADLAYAVGAFGAKIGAPARGERLAKYNRLLEIEAAL